MQIGMEVTSVLRDSRSRFGMKDKKSDSIVSQGHSQCQPPAYSMDANLRPIATIAQEPARNASEVTDVHGDADLSIPRDVDLS